MDRLSLAVRRVLEKMETSLAEGKQCHLQSDKCNHIAYILAVLLLKLGNKKPKI